MISFLVPFSTNEGTRRTSWRWLKKHWSEKLPEAEIVMGTDDQVPFSKSVAVNRAAEKAKGSIFVMIDADAYLDHNVIRRCAAQIEQAGKPIWFIPYSHLFRLTRETSTRLLDSPPEKPIRIYEGHLPRSAWEDAADNAYGAMLQMFSREAFEAVGGMDERFRGWGGEDHAMVRALDTLYGPHLTTRNYIYHLWHPRPGKGATRVWDGQASPRSNYTLIRRYRVATGNPRLMKRLLKEKDRLAK